MNPVILIQRTMAGDAFVYARKVERETTHIAQMPAVPIGTPLPALRPDEVELLRTDPEKLLGSQ